MKNTENIIKSIHDPASHPFTNLFTGALTEPVRHFHRTVPGYEETPLWSLDRLAAREGVKGIYAKDESFRFGLNAFKGLGGVYAMGCILCKRFGLAIEKTSFTDLQSGLWRERLRDTEFVTATDGNHGRGVAWAASQFGCRAHVYMPKGSQEVRAAAIRSVSHGLAEAVITDRNYDDTVRYAAEMAAEKGWVLIQDTSWDGYTEIPAWIVQGYTTMAYEAVSRLDRLGVVPTHVFLQAGVGAMAGGVAGFLSDWYGEKCPQIIITEPTEAACIYESMRHYDGHPKPATGNGQTIMAGLNCGEPCTLTFPVLAGTASWFLSCPDYVAARGMRIYAAARGNDPRIVSGESGAATMGAFSLIAEAPQYKDLKAQMGITAESVILLFNTEGDTDPVNYEKIVYDGRCPVPEQ